MNAVMIGVLVTLLLCGIYGALKGALRIVFAFAEVLVLIIVIGLLTTDFRAFIGIFIVTVIALFIISRFIPFFSKLPVIRTVDRFFGTLIGLLLGLLLIWLFFMIVAVFAATPFGTTVLGMIRENPFLLWLYQNNGIEIFARQHFTWYEPIVSAGI